LRNLTLASRQKKKENCQGRLNNSNNIKNKAPYVIS
jgi:hypothetical protein